MIWRTIIGGQIYCVEVEPGYKSIFVFTKVSWKEHLKLDRTSGALCLTHSAIRRQYRECFCLRPGKVCRITRDAISLHEMKEYFQEVPVFSMD